MSCRRPRAPTAPPTWPTAAGRQILLHGAAAVGLEDVAYPGANGGPALFPVSPTAYDGRCPTASPLVPQPPLCEVQASRSPFAQSTAPASGDDFAQMRALGFDVVRLVLNWSQLEPTPGTYSKTYLARVAQVVWLGAPAGDLRHPRHAPGPVLALHPAGQRKSASPAGLHAVGWQRRCAGAGPSRPDGKAGCALYGIDELNPAESAAFANFWQNSPVSGAAGAGSGDRVCRTTTSARWPPWPVASSSDPAVLGYELMNEPQPGSSGSLPAGNGYQASSEDLYPFYTRAVEALTGVRDGRADLPGRRADLAR